MLKNTIINRKVVAQVARALGELNTEVVFVGGAVVSMYTDDPAAEDVRPTKDVDLFLEIVSALALESLRETLIAKGFYQSSEDDVLCRFRLTDIKVDVMSTEAVGWAPGSRWFEAGYHQVYLISLEDISIRLLPLAYYLATKFEAFDDRGGIDPRTSHDFEDIVYILNYTLALPEKLKGIKGTTVGDYLKKWFNKILNQADLQEAIQGHLYFENRDARFKKNNIHPKLTQTWPLANPKDHYCES